jgi:hypothetical protein
MLVVKMTGFLKHFGSIGEWAKSQATIQAYRTKDTYFTRTTAKLTFEKLVSFILGNNRNSAQVALNDFFRDTEEEPVAKQTLFEARDKISYKAFADLSEKVVDDFYSAGDSKTYNSYTLLGVDGSIFQAPQGAFSTFGGQKSAKSDIISAQARGLMISDVLNRIVVDSALKPVDTGERKVFLEMLENLRSFKKSILIFDRGFYSKQLVDALNKKGLNFLFRVKKNCQKAIDTTHEPDQTVFVGETKLRIINVVLPTREVEKLVTNVFDSDFTASDFATIYEKRWGIETSYLMVKERLAIENFTSAKENLMLQDFFAAVVTYNLMEIACMEQEEKRLAENIDIPRKHRQSANRNIVAHEVRECFFSVFIETDPAKIDRKLAKIQRIILRFFKDIRPGRTNSRTVKFPSKKFPMNKKRNI